MSEVIETTNCHDCGKLMQVSTLDIPEECALVCRECFDAQAEIDRMFESDNQPPRGA